MLLLLACADPAPTFTEIQTEIFTPSCAFSTCHSATAPAANLNLAEGDAYAMIVGVESLTSPGDVQVVAGDSVGSYLYAKCAGDSSIIGSPMPDGQPSLDAERLAILAAWIDDGAQNN